MNHRRIMFLGILFVLMALLPSGASFAKEIVQITITGPGLAETLAVTDAQQLATLDLESLMNSSPGVAPSDPEADYFELQLAVGDGNEVIATFVYHYFPGINSDYGYLNFTDMIGDNASSIGGWFRLSDSLDRALRHLLHDAGVRFGISPTNCVESKQTAGA